MLCALLHGRSAQLLSDVMPPLGRLLSVCNGLHSSQTRDISTIVQTSELENLPQATETADQLLDSTQLESLAIFKRYNIAQPDLRGQVILAKVVRNTRDRLLVDPGYYGLNWVSKADLDSAVSYDAAGQAIPRASLDILPGEYVKVRISHLNTPYGDMQLDPVGIPQEVRQTLVWQELQRRMKTGQPVQGRILNPTFRGYAVGVAGYVALLEHTHVRSEMAQQIGTLQQFYIHKMDKDSRRITLSPIRSKEDVYANYRASM